MGNKEYWLIFVTADQPSILLAEKKLLRDQHTTSVSYQHIQS